MCSHEDLLGKVAKAATQTTHKLSFYSYIVPHARVSECALEIKEGLLCACSVIVLHGTASASESNNPNNIASLPEGVRTFCHTPTLLVSSMLNGSATVLVVVLDRESDHKACNAFVRECLMKTTTPLLEDTRIVVFVSRKPMKAVQDLAPDNVTRCIRDVGGGSGSGCVVSWVQRYVSSYHVNTSLSSLLTDSVTDLVELVCVVHHSGVGHKRSPTYLEDVLTVTTMLSLCGGDGVIAMGDVQAMCELFFKKHMVFAGNRKPRLVRLDLLSFKTTLP